VRIARIFNAYGPHMRSDDGRAVPNFIAAAMRNEPIVVYGDGQATRSFQFATDCIRGLVALMESKYVGPVNIGSDRETPIAEIANVIASHVAVKLGRQKAVPVRFLPKRPDDPVRRKPDIALAKEVLGWQPLVPLEEGLDATINWFLESRKTDIARDRNPGARIDLPLGKIIPEVHLRVVSSEG
jgi:UDP-glucuronate decarboxylase